MRVIAEVKLQSFWKMFRPASDVIMDPLMPTSAEKEIWETGFKAYTNVSVINLEKGMSRYQNKNLADLLVQMAPVYMVLSYPVCDHLLKQVPPHRIEDLRYLPTANSDYLEANQDEITPSLEVKKFQILKSNLAFREVRKRRMKRPPRPRWPRWREAFVHHFFLLYTWSLKYKTRMNTALF